MLRMVETADRGKIVVATQDLDTLGLEVLHEPALFSAPRWQSAEDKSSQFPWQLQPVLARRSRSPQIWTDYWWFKKQTASVQETVMGFFYDVEWAESLHRDILSLHGMVERYRDIDWEEFAKLTMIMKFNSFGFQDYAGNRLGHALFEIACRLSHSCAPNCSWVTDPNDRTIRLRLIRPVAAGKELTVDYLGMAFKPIRERQAKYKSSKNFYCQCERCCRPDDTRRFQCSATASCPGVHFCDSSGERDVLTDCSECGQSAVRPDELFQRERELESTLEDIQNQMEQMGMTWELDKQIRKLPKPPHPLHYLALQVNALKTTLSHMDGDVSATVGYTKDSIEIKKTLLGTEFHAIVAEEYYHLGDYLMDVCGSLAQAESALQRAVQIHQIYSGDENPEYQQALERLLELQKRRVMDATNVTTRNLTTCALCGKPASKKCQRCLGVVYCCREHQKRHWPGLHKKVCQAASP